MSKILVVDEDKNFIDRLVKIEEMQEHLIHSVVDPLQALEMIAKEYYHLIMVSNDLEEFDSIQILNSCRNIQPNIVVMLLSEKENEAAEEQAIKNKIDLCLSKEKNLNLIGKYINQKIDHGVDNTVTEKLKSEKEVISLDKRSGEVYKGEERIHLTRKEFLLLKYLLENKNRIISRSELIEDIWGIEQTNRIRTIDVHIRHLREKLGLYSIVSVHGIGYKWSEKE